MTNLQVSQAPGVNAQKCIQTISFYMHTVSGDVATKAAWVADFETTDRESWFGLPIEECKDLHPIDDMPYLVKVFWNGFEWEQDS